MGMLDTGAKMSDVLEKLTVSSFARRRLPVVLVRLKMSETVKQVSESDAAMMNLWRWCRAAVR